MRTRSKYISGPLELVGGADPLRQTTLTSEDIDGALDELGIAITLAGRGPRPVRRRRPLASRRTAVVLAVALATLTAGAAIGAVTLGARTGLFPSKSDQAVGGPGEELNPAAPDFRAVALQIASDIPYPTGYDSWRDFLVSNEIRSADDGVLESTGALHGWFAASAFCAWLQSWRQASIAGDAGATMQAAQTIAQAPGWKAVTDEDPNPDPAAPNDPGAETGTLFGWMLPYRAAVLAGDRARVERLLARGYGDGKCWSSDPAWMAQVRAHRDDWGRLSPSETAQKYEQFLARERP